MEQNRLRFSTLAKIHLRKQVILFLVMLPCMHGIVISQNDDPLSYPFAGHYGQVEVGGRYAGVEFHESRPLPSRISFYYPVANSIDLSTDYWKRGDSRPMVIGVRVGSGVRQWLGNEPWDHTLSPHKVVFQREENGLRYSVSFEFCLNEPALVFTLCLKNLSGQPAKMEVYTHLKTTLRTCQTYARMDSASTEFDSSGQSLEAHFREPATGNATVFVSNVGARPVSWTSDARELGIADRGASQWINSRGSLARGSFPPPRRGNAAAAFMYQEELPPGDSLSVVQVIGSCRRGEVDSLINRLKSSWHAEVNAYDAYVREKSFREASLTTGEPWADRSAIWALGLVAANAHHLDSSVVPMPCPAEYNFFFTHDVLLTDLGAVNYDVPRVKRDLLYIASHAKNNIIPHAYYWRDNGFQTEFCTPDNWNHLWFVLVTASYLRHSFDDSTCAFLYPLVTRSLEEILKQRKGDNLMYAFRPDWWDIGRQEGPRSYITILTIRALGDYLYLSARLGRQSPRLGEYEEMAESMRKSLEARLWDARAGYLMNYNGNLQDRHFYMGSLLAAAFKVIEPSKAMTLVRTAAKELLDRRIGIRNVMPPDFHTDSVRAFFKFAGNEAGDRYTYANGGVWPHCNAWYTMALQATGKPDEAFQFFRTTMTLDGIAQSPQGQPAMYEYRFSDPLSPEFGKIDKPSFLWAGGFYLYTLYHLMGVVDDEWNVSVAAPIPQSFGSIHYTVAFGNQKRVSVKRSGRLPFDFVADGAPVPSRVVPLRLAKSSDWEIRPGSASDPYLERLNAILHDARYNRKERKLRLEISSFAGHHVIADLVAREKPRGVQLDGKKILTSSTRRNVDGSLNTTVRFVGSPGTQNLEVQF
jgi:hypothetical protein